MGQVNTCCTDPIKEEAIHLFDDESVRENYRKYLKAFKKTQEDPKTIAHVVEPVLLKSFLSNCSLNTMVQLFVYDEGFTEWLVKLGYLNGEINPKAGEIVRIWLKFMSMASNNDKRISSAGFMEYFAKNKPDKFSLGKQTDTSELVYTMLDDLLKCDEASKGNTIRSLFGMRTSHDFKCGYCSRSWTDGSFSFGLTDLIWKDASLKDNIQHHLELLKEKKRYFCPDCHQSAPKAQDEKWQMPSKLIVRFTKFTPLKLEFLLSEKEIWLEEKLYELRQLLVFEGNRRSGHFFMIRHFEKTGWRLIENEFCDTLAAPAILGETFHVKMVFLEEKTKVLKTKSASNQEKSDSCSLVQIRRIRLIGALKLKNYGKELEEKEGMRGAFGKWDEVKCKGNLGIKRTLFKTEIQ